MARILDERMVDDIIVESVSYKPNVKRTTIEIVDEETIEVKEYVVLTRIVYILLDTDGKKLDRKVVNHDLMPLANPVTSVVFINNIDTLSSLVKAAAIADRNSFTVAD